jgi:phosphoenolpyruvate carboxykinase (GTP)
MRIMTRMGKGALERSATRHVRALRAHGRPPAGSRGGLAPWPCNEEKYIVHYPETREIWSFGSGYGGNALLGKKCFALRIASGHGARRGLAREHMLILKLTLARGGREVRRAARFPSAVRQDEPGDADPALEGWQVGDRRRRHRLDEVRRRRARLVAINPEAGLLRRRAQHGGERRTRTPWPRAREHHLHQLRR